MTEWLAQGGFLPPTSKENYDRPGAMLKGQVRTALVALLASRSVSCRVCAAYQFLDSEPAQNFLTRLRRVFDYS